jgi:hypothetical protein
MKGILALFALALVLVAMSGCAQNPGGAPQNASADASGGEAQNASNASVQDGYREYRQKTFSFDYPEALFADESLGSYNDGAGYAFVALQGRDESDPALLVYYIRFGNIPLIANRSASEIAKSFLESDSGGEDMMGVLHQSSDKGNISLFTTRSGYAAAEMEFSLRGPQDTVILHGYAIQLYDPATTVSMKARVLAADSGKAKAARDRFVESVKISDLAR